MDVYNVIQVNLIIDINKNILELLEIIITRHTKQIMFSSNFCHFMKVSENFGIVYKLFNDIMPEIKVNIVKPPFEWPYNNVIKNFDDEDILLIQLQQYILEHVI